MLLLVTAWAGRGTVHHSAQSDRQASDKITFIASAASEVVTQVVSTMGEIRNASDRR